MLIRGYNSLRAERETIYTERSAHASSSLFQALSSFPLSFEFARLSPQVTFLNLSRDSGRSSVSQAETSGFSMLSRNVSQDT